MDISAVGVGVSLLMDGERCMKARVVLGAVAPTPMRAVKAEKMIMGEKFTEDLAERAGIQASKESRPISDVRATKAYRKAMVAVLTKRALLEAKGRASKRR